MSWIAITTDHLRERKASAIVDALQEAALGYGQADPVPAIIASTTAFIRKKIKACSRNVLDVDPAKIPNDLLDLACRRIVREGKNRLELELTADERETIREDNAELERIASCSSPVEATDNPEVTATVQNPTPTPRISSPRRTFSRANQAGI